MQAIKTSKQLAVVRACMAGCEGQVCHRRLASLVDWAEATAASRGSPDQTWTTRRHRLLRRRPPPPRSAKPPGFRNQRQARMPLPWILGLRPHTQYPCVAPWASHWYFRPRPSGEPWDPRTFRDTSTGKLRDKSVHSAHSFQHVRTCPPTRSPNQKWRHNDVTHHPTRSTRSDSRLGAISYRWPAAFRNLLEQRPRASIASHVRSKTAPRPAGMAPTACTICA